MGRVAIWIPALALSLAIAVALVRGRVRMPGKGANLWLTVPVVTFMFAAGAATGSSGAPLTVWGFGLPAILAVAWTVLLVAVLVHVRS